MAILVTGGAGYIGSHTCVELLKQGRDVVIADNFSNAEPEVTDRVRELAGRDAAVYRADILDETALHRIFSEYAIEAVIHFAGFKAVGESVQIPLEYYRNNVAGTLSLCRVMAARGCKKLVFSSSATVYGLSNSVPFREGMPLSATNPYGMTKVIIERMLTDTAASDPGWSVALLRYFNPIGAHHSSLLGENPAGIPNNLVPYVAQVAAGRLERLTVHGGDYETPDGTGVRDYLHVMDLADGHLKALDYVLGHAGAEAVNLGSGTGFSVLEVVAAYEKACGKNIPYAIGPRRPGDIAVCRADTAKAEALFGWRASASLDEMCRDSWNFSKRFL